MASDSASADATPLETGMPKHVLLVEDDAILAMSITHTLTDAGVAEVQHCVSTQEALVALREATPDVVIVDVHLSDRDDGWAVAELVSEMVPNPPRIIFSTGSPDDIPERIAQMGPVLEKPYDGNDLLDIIREPKRRGVIWRLTHGMR